MFDHQGILDAAKQSVKAVCEKSLNDSSSGEVKDDRGHPLCNDGGCVFVYLDGNFSAIDLRRIADILENVERTTLPSWYSQTPG